MCVHIDWQKNEPHMNSSIHLSIYLCMYRHSNNDMHFFFLPLWKLSPRLISNCKSDVAKWYSDFVCIYVIFIASLFRYVTLSYRTNSWVLFFNSQYSCNRLKRLFFSFAWYFWCNEMFCQPLSHWHGNSTKKKLVRLCISVDDTLNVNIVYIYTENCEYRHSYTQ